MANEIAENFRLQVNGGSLWLYCTDDQNAPVTVCLGKASRAVTGLALALAKLELSRALYLLPRGH